jgi:hypothetical protein
MRDTHAEPRQGGEAGGGRGALYLSRLGCENAQGWTCGLSPVNRSEQEEPTVLGAANSTCEPF